MREFWVLFKHELKMLFPIFGYNRKRKHDIFGTILSLLLTLFVAVVFVLLLVNVASGYLTTKVDKVLNPKERAVELLNILYLIIMIFMVAICLRKMYQTLTAKVNREIYLRLPVKKQTILLSKISAILVWTFLMSLFVVLPVNIIFMIVLDASVGFIIKTLFVSIFLPIIVFGISMLLFIPYIYVVNFLKNKYFLNFALLSGLLVVAFVLYAKVLQVIQLALQTGSIKFLFNEKFISILQTLLAWAYPANIFANLMLSRNLIVCVIIILAITLILTGVAYHISHKLFDLTLFSYHEHKVNTKHKKLIQNSPVVSLLKKEFISVYRNPTHLFSYFAIAMAMPVFVYCCYSLFKSLIINAFGIKIVFPLALLVLLIFSILTNTFCATNVSRDQLSFLKIKTLPVKPYTLLWAKVLFCGIVSSISILLSIVVLVVTKEIGFGDAMLLFVITTMFAFAQILIATKIDLKNTKLSAGISESQSTSNKTITKVVCIGLIVALIMGLASIVIYILALGSTSNFVISLNLQTWYSYVLAVVIGVIYFVLAFVFYRHKINVAFENLTD